MHLINKVGLVPFCDDPNTGDRVYLLHKPKPKHNPQDDIPFGLCRGTRRYVEGDALIDARDVGMLSEAQIKALEPYAHTAIQEAEEELGLLGLTKERLIELGPITYPSPNKTPYLIFWFATRIKDPQSIAKALDAEATLWTRLQEAYAYSEAGRFKKGYIEVLERVSRL